jgi:DNA-binding MarR family transcriptional regulator
MHENHQLFHVIQQLSRHFSKNLNEVLQPLGIYSAQWVVLFTLKTKGMLTQSELCEYLAIEAPPMTRNIQRLMKEGYIKKVPGKDKRSNYIVLTEEALAMYPKWEQAALDLNKSLLGHLPDSTQNELFKLLSCWTVELRRNGGNM